MGRDRDSAIVRCLNRRRPVWGIIIIGTAVHCGPRTHSNVRTTPTLEWLPWLHGNCKFESQVNLAPAGMPRADVHCFCRLCDTVARAIVVQQLLFMPFAFNLIHVEIESQGILSYVRPA